MPRLREVATMEYVVQPAVQEWPAQGQWSYDDYARLPDDGWKYEVIRGELHMSPAPSTRHQIAIGNIHVEMSLFLRQTDAGQAIFSPVDVILPGGLGTPVQPDILFVSKSNLDIIKETHIEGVPDLVVEVLSPSNWVDDRRTKFTVYAEAGVAEYWIVDPKTATVEVYRLVDERYELIEKYGAGDTVSSLVLAGFSISVAEVFAQ